jgi:uncharacterized membrane protein YqaE (UPF0057 family)
MSRTLSILIPPVAVLNAGRPGAAAFNLLLTASGWVPGVIHAWAIVADGEKAREALIERQHFRRITGRSAEFDDGRVEIVRKEPIYTFLASALAGVVICGAALSETIQNRYRGLFAKQVSVSPDPAVQPVVKPPAVEVEKAATVTAEKVEVPAAPQVDSRSLASVLSERTKWPIKVTLRSPLTVALFDGDERVGEASLVPGQKLTATSISEAGMLSLLIGQQSVELEMENTDFVAQALRAASQQKREVVNEAETSEQFSTGQVAPVRGTQSIEQQLAALKQRFPAKYRTSIGTFTKDRTIAFSNIRRTGDLGNGRSGIEVRTGSSAVGAIGHTDSISIEVPAVEVWSDYRGWVASATPQGLSVTVQKLRLRVQEDEAKYSTEANSATGSARRAQCAATVTWIRGTFRPYLNQLDSLTK